MSFCRTLARLGLVTACVLAPLALAEDGRRGGGNQGGGYYRGGNHGGGNHGGGNYRGGNYRGGNHGGGYYRGGGHHNGGHDDHWSGGWVIGIPWGYYGGGYGYGYGYGPGYGYGYGPGYYGYGAPYGYGGYERRVIIERERTQAPEVPAGPPPAAVWYYCDSAGAYYPYVNSCPEPWRQVPTEPSTP